MSAFSVVRATPFTSSLGSAVILPVIPCSHPDDARADHDFPARTFTWNNF
jgi:hypothetical protein